MIHWKLFKALLHYFALFTGIKTKFLFILQNCSIFDITSLYCAARVCEKTNWFFGKPLESDPGDFHLKMAV